MVFTAQKDDHSSFPQCTHLAYAPLMVEYNAEMRKSGSYQLKFGGLVLGILGLAGYTIYVIANNRATICATLQRAGHSLLGFLTPHQREEGRTYEMVRLIPNTPYLP